MHEQVRHRRQPSKGAVRGKKQERPLHTREKQGRRGWQQHAAAPPHPSSRTCALLSPKYLLSSSSCSVRVCVSSLVMMAKGSGLAAPDRACSRTRAAGEGARACCLYCSQFAHHHAPLTCRAGLRCLQRWCSRGPGRRGRLRLSGLLTCSARMYPAYRAKKEVPVALSQGSATCRQAGLVSQALSPIRCSLAAGCIMYAQASHACFGGSASRQSTHLDAAVAQPLSQASRHKHKRCVPHFIQAALQPQHVGQSWLHASLSDSSSSSTLGEVAHKLHQASVAAERGRSDDEVVVLSQAYRQRSG